MVNFLSFNCERYYDDAISASDTVELNGSDFEESINTQETTAGEKPEEKPEEKSKRRVMNTLSVSYYIKFVLIKTLILLS